MSKHNRERRSSGNNPTPTEKIVSQALDRFPTGRMILRQPPSILTPHAPPVPLRAVPIKHAEAPSIELPPVKVLGENPDMPGVYDWEISGYYYGTFHREENGFYLGNSPWAFIGITAWDETAKHDWRDFQHIKNCLVGKDWEGVELYPTESRLRDPSNRFYLWCVPAGIFRFGFNQGRCVLDQNQSEAPQRPFPSTRRGEPDGSEESRTAEGSEDRSPGTANPGASEP